MTASLGRILVVDDLVVDNHPSVGAMLRDLLLELGYVVKNAVGGAEALQLVPLFEPDVVLLDLLMPEMSGADVLDRLRRGHPTLPVIVMTGNDDVELARFRREIGPQQCRSEPRARTDTCSSLVAAARTPCA